MKGGGMLIMDAGKVICDLSLQLPIWIRHCVNTQLGHSSAKNLGKSITAGSEEVPMFDSSC